MSERKYLFYAKEGELHPAPELPAGYHWTLWRPSLSEVTPKGISLIPFGVWWLLHNLRVFSNRGYGLLLIYHKEALVHRSVITPRYFRFPFMQPDDLQAGDTWTSDDHRGKGLATAALRLITGAAGSAGQRYWYVVEDNNQASIRVVEKAGFRLVGAGSRRPRFGVAPLGGYWIEQQIERL